jgi:hypothetical protein
LTRTSSASRTAGAVLAAAAAYAAAELVLAYAVGRFAVWGRAEALLFYAFRPWLLVVAAALAARAGWRGRFAFYASCLALAGLAETILLLSLGATDPWRGMLLGLAAGAGLAVAADLVVQLARRLIPRAGAAAGAVLLLALFAAGALRPYEAVVLRPTRTAEAVERPALLLMTALPLVWGEGGAFDPASRPDESFLYLQREFDVRPIDAIEPAALRGARLMLLAQPRLLAPEELVALDGWVRAGGRALILADPQLDWPSRWPPGDVRRPPRASLLGPLLVHWGLSLEPPAQDGYRVELLKRGAVARRLILESPGRFVAQGRACRVARADFLARCRIGRGDTLLVADADLLRAQLWASAGANGAQRHARQADNALAVADWLDELARLSRGRAESPVDWVPSGADHRHALFRAALPIAFALALGLALLYVGRRERQQTYPQEHPPRTTQEQSGARSRKVPPAPSWDHKIP